MSITPRAVKHFLSIDGIEGLHAALTTAEARTLYRDTVAAHRGQGGGAAVALYVWSPAGHFSMIARTVVRGGRGRLAD